MGLNTGPKARRERAAQMKGFSMRNLRAHACSLFGNHEEIRLVVVDIRLTIIP